MSETKGRGRPPGAKTIKDIVEVEPSRCSNCGSSKRTGYENPYYRDYSGQGLEFIGIYYRACKCIDCGRARRDLERVYAPAESNNQKPVIQDSSTLDNS